MKRRVLLKSTLVTVFALGMMIALMGQSGEGLAGEQVLHIAFDAADLKTLDPHFAATTPDRAVVDMVFNGLVRYKPGDIRFFEPDLAESWEVSPDGKVWTFHLRHGVMCHPWDGNPAYELTSEDVVYSLQKSADSKRSAYAGEYTGMTFKAVDPYTVEIALDKAISRLLLFPKLANYAGGFIVCKKAVEALGDEGFKTHPVGTGPFMFQSYTPMEKVVLVRNDRYFRGTPKLAGVEVWYIPDVSAREAGLQKSELDVIEGPPSQPWVEKVRGFPGVIVDIFGPGETAVVHWNMTAPPLDNIKVRWALDYCLDREEVRAAIGPAISVPLCSAVPEVLPGGMTCDEVGGLRYDVDRTKAKALLAEAGYPNGFSTEAIISERAEYLLPMENIVAQLRECGVNVELEVVDHPTFHTLIRQNASPIVLYSAWRPNADVFLTRFYHSASEVVKGKKPDTNFSHIGAVDADGDGVVDSIDYQIEAARVELGPESQAQFWKAAQLRLLELNVAYPLYIKQFTYARKEYVVWGYDLLSTLALYPQINELTEIRR